MKSRAEAKLLVVDDNPENRDLLTRRLRRLGYSDMVQAADGVEALEALAAGAFDVVLLDPDGAAGVEYGVSGVPETFAISQDGTILAKHSGELTPEIADRLLASADQSAKR